MYILPSTTDDFLLDGLSPADLYSYSRTCKDAHDAVSSHIRRNFSLQNVLHRYFKPEEISKFRELQAYTGMFISGSTALQFFERTEYLDSDLDLYVEHRLRRPIALWLRSIGYKLLPHPTHPDLTFEENLEMVPDIAPFIDASDTFPSATQKGYFGAATVLNFEKSGPHRKVQLITSHHSPLEMVLNFHSTCVMNIITHEKAYSLFPRGTFKERRSMVYLPVVNTNRADALAKYTRRGWTMVHEITDQEFDDPCSAFSHGPRHLGDSKCLTLPILPKLDLPPSHLEANSWSLWYDAHMEPQMIFTLFQLRALRFTYLVLDKPLRSYISRNLPKLMKQNEDLKELDASFQSLITKYWEETRKSLKSSSI